MPSASHQHYSPHNMPIAAHKVTVISPLALVHAFNQPTLAQCLAHNITAAQPYLALQLPSPHTRNQQLSHPYHAPPRKVSTTCCCSSSQPSLPTMASSAMALGHHVEQGASTCYPSSLLIDPTRVERLGWSPSKSL